MATQSPDWRVNSRLLRAVARLLHDVHPTFFPSPTLCLLQLISDRPQSLSHLLTEGTVRRNLSQSHRLAVPTAIFEIDRHPDLKQKVSHLPDPLPLNHLLGSSNSRGADLTCHLLDLLLFLQLPLTVPKSLHRLLVGDIPHLLRQSIELVREPFKPRGCRGQHLPDTSTGAALGSHHTSGHQGCGV